MKCEQFFPWLESESYVRAALARQHARRCESCRAAASMLDEVKQGLAASEPLPERLKHAFLTVGETMPVVLPEQAEDHRSRARLWLAALAAAVLIAISPWLISLSRHADVAEQARDHYSAQSDITMLTVDSAQELAQLEVNLAALNAQLIAATVDAQRLSAEEELARMLVDYHRLFAGNDVR
jgi:hypothetical protein